ncbi:MAG: HAD family phosphatase [Pirellulaceae bacterium]
MSKRPFLYFDMGNVLLFFSHERMAAQMAAVAGIAPQQAWKILFDGDLGIRHERGQLSTAAFYDEFCRAAGARADRQALDLAALDRTALDNAANDIFWLHAPMVGLIGRLNAAGYRLGVLSNTNEAHWQYATGRFAYLTTMFHVHAMSFRIRAMKPDPRIYQAAAELAGVQPRDILFTDDRAENVAGAIAAGWDAVLFTTPAALSAELFSRGIVANY